MAKNKKDKSNNINKKDLQDKMSQSSIKSELKKVTWPTGIELSKSTGAVLLLVLIVAFIIFVSDTIFLQGNNFVSDKAIEFNKQRNGSTIAPDDIEEQLKVETPKVTEKPAEKTDKSEEKAEENKKSDKKDEKKEEKAESKEEAKKE